MNDPKIRVSIVDDEPEIAELLKDLIAGEPDMEFVASYTSAEEAYIGVAGTTPNVVIMDIGLPGESGISGMMRIKQKFPNLSFLMYTIWENERVFEALRAGADGYILKRDETSSVLGAIRDVYHGLSAASPYIARMLFESFRGKKNALEALNQQEMEILDLLKKGKMIKAMSLDLNVSESKIKRIIRGVYDKLQVNSRSEAIVVYLNNF